MRFRFSGLCGSSAARSGKNRCGRSRPWHVAPLFALAALATLTGCESQAGYLFFQTANAASRTVADLVLTSYANLVAALFALI